jgi:hypothetical protein
MTRPGDSDVVAGGAGGMALLRTTSHRVEYIRILYMYIHCIYKAYTLYIQKIYYIYTKYIQCIY